MMIIYDELKNDHEAVKEMTRIEEMSSRASTSKVKLFEEVKTALTARVRAEEKVFYDAIKRQKSAHDATLEGYEEHHVADVLMKLSAPCVNLFTDALFSGGHDTSSLKPNVCRGVAVPFSEI
jgi:hypothetical protein